MALLQTPRNSSGSTGIYPHHRVHDTTRAHPPDAEGNLALKYIQNFETEGTLAAWPYWKSPSARWEDTKEMEKLFGELIAMTDRLKERTITASTMKEGLHRYGLFGFCSPSPQLIDQATFLTMACDELSEMKLRHHNPLHTTPTQNTEHQSSPSSEGDDT